MKSMITAGLVALMMLAGNAQAVEKTPQQHKMVSCNKQAGDKKGDERAAFMKQWLSARKAGSTHSKKSTTKSKTAPKKTDTPTEQ